MMVLLLTAGTPRRCTQSALGPSVQYGSSQGTAPLQSFLILLPHIRLAVHAFCLAVNNYGYRCYYACKTHDAGQPYLRPSDVQQT